MIFYITVIRSSFFLLIFPPGKNCACSGKIYFFHGIFYCSQVGEGRLKKSVLHLVIKYVLILKNLFFLEFVLSSWSSCRESFLSCSLSYSNFKLRPQFCLRSYWSQFSLKDLVIVQQF